MGKPMNADEKVIAARAELDRTLTFFPRVDAKVTALFAINAGMIGVLAVNVKTSHLSNWVASVPAAIALLGIVSSTVSLYRSSFPNLKGGGGSLVFFGEIAKRTEGAYMAEFASQTPAQYADALLAQVWRNSQILGEKFGHAKLAFQLTAFTLIPWGLFLLASSLLNGSVPVIK